MDSPSSPGASLDFAFHKQCKSSAACCGVTLAGVRQVRGARPPFRGRRCKYDAHEAGADRPRGARETIPGGQAGRGRRGFLDDAGDPASMTGISLPFCPGLLCKTRGARGVSECEHAAEEGTGER